MGVANFPNAPQWYVGKRQHVLAGIYGNNDIPDLHQTTTGNENGKGRTDVSPKGSLDTPLVPLIDYINSLGVIFTTSSCSGRIAIFADGSKEKTVINQDSKPDTSYKIGGKGLGGRWLFISHDPEAVNAMLHSAAQDAHVEDSRHLSWLQTLFDVEESSQPLQTIVNSERKTIVLSPNERIVHFKFEPMVLHIQASNFESACCVQRAALSAGFRESGIGSNFLVGVRCASLSLDVPIAVMLNSSTHQFKLLVSAQYIQFLLRSTQERFSENQRRIDLFFSELKKQFAPSTREDPLVRRERKRAEGLARQMARKLDVSLDINEGVQKSS